MPKYVPPAVEHRVDPLGRTPSGAGRAGVLDATVREGVLATAGGHVHYLESGPTKGPLVILVHGWPAIAMTWYGQMAGLAAAGYRVIAPDMRGYGGSSAPAVSSRYALPHLVGDLRALLAATGRAEAIWVGHDWGAAVVWALAAHHPKMCAGVCTLVVPYRTLDRGVDAMLPYVNRQVYPRKRFPFAQFDYMVHYEEAFDEVTAQFDANPDRLVRALYRPGDPAILDGPSPRATITRDGGWFGGAPIPDTRLDTAILPEFVYESLVSSLRANGFSGPNSWYLNHHRNLRYSEESLDDGRLDMPVLFVESRYEPTADTVRSRLAEPMRDHCTNLVEVTMDAGHWVGLEKPVEVNAALLTWMGGILGTPSS